jgi:phosphonate transport system substrate-binding protein
MPEPYGCLRYFSVTLPGEDRFVNRDRRLALKALGAGACALAAKAAAQPRSLRLGLTAVFLDDEIRFLLQWRAYLEQRVGRKVEFVQRGRYRETVELLREGRLDAAWICGFPYVRFKSELQLIAVPLFEGKPLYRSYLIVPTSDATTRSILDLRGRVFAFSDPDSNSGYLYPSYVLRTSGERADAFFKRAFFTWAHSKVVDAVSTRLAHGGAVDGYVWETLHRTRGDLTAGTRVVTRSPEFGHPPIVARADLAPELAQGLRAAFTGMTRDAEGRALLANLNLDGFAPGNEGLFDSIEAMWRVVQTG